MKIGYVVEDSVHEAVLKGLQLRTPGWCPNATTIRGNYRGTGRGAIMRDARKACIELTSKGAEIVIVLVDSDLDPFLDIKRRLFDKLVDFHHLLVVGVAERNIECWLNADKDYVATEFGVERKLLDVDDPKPLIHSTIRAMGDNIDRVKHFVIGAPGRAWINNSPSFKKFYEDARDLSQQRQCPFPNELQK